MRPHYNKSLFSNYYLDELLPRDDGFRVSASEIEEFYKEIKQIWDKKRFEVINEDQLRKHFLDKVLDLLGWSVDVNAPIPAGEWSKRPDYALFLDNDYLTTAQKGKKDDYFKKVACIGEAKRWGRPLDKKVKAEADPFEIQNPSLQISRYLWLTDVKWGLLSDGKYWRLYERDTSKRLDVFYEIDLEELIESGSLEDFRYFYLFFRKDAFPRFIEKVYKQSIDYAEAVGKELKQNIYHALKILAQGFLKTPGNSLTERDLKKIHDNVLILLYRLLFILYAEYRDLLPLGKNKLYAESYSLDAFKKEIVNRLDGNETIAASTHGYWDKLKGLFEIVNLGNNELEVPPYNGGLFDPEKHGFFVECRLGDLYLARAVDLLSRSKDKAFIDYGSLEIRHIGSIYEGLLEYKLKIADQDLVPTKVKGKEVFVSFQEAAKHKKKINEDDKVHKGEVYLVTDKGERKATGSYYTPDYIVKYIVENTIGPLVADKRHKVSDKIDELKGKIKRSRGKNRKLYEKEVKQIEGTLIDEILSIKILDPAMGSGHFLVEATDFLARELLKALSDEPIIEQSEEVITKKPSVSYGLIEQEKEDIRWARREVVEKCIFGVDLNPMAVELAKLSLWLYTVAKNRPLNFLDHHLRCGNSLIGTGIKNLAILPVIKKKKSKKGTPQQLGLFESIFKEKINLLLGAFSQIEGLPSDTIEQIREKEKFYQNFKETVSRFQDVADVWTSVYFENDVEFGSYQRLQDNLRSPEAEWEKFSAEPWFKRARDISDGKRFFHWELEFPEVFFEGHQYQENPGFDVVVGNPPYGIIFAMDEKKYLEIFFSSFERNTDFYAAFSQLSIELSRNQGISSLIIPNTFILGPYFNGLRKFFLDNTYVRGIVDFGYSTVFPDPNVYSAIFFCEKQKVPRVQGETELLKATAYNGIIKVISHEKVQLRELPIDTWRLYHPIVHKATMNSMKIDDVAYVKDVGINYWTIGRGKKRGKSIGSRILYQGPKQNQKDIPFLKGSDFDKYQVPISQDHWLRHNYTELLDPNSDVFRYSPEYLFINSKIIYRQTSDRLIATIDRKGYLVDKTIHVIVLKEKSSPYSYKFLLAFLNSKLANYIYNEYTAEEGRTFAQVKTFRVKQLPIRHISFSTPKRKRRQLFDKAKILYKTYIKKNDLNSIVSFIKQRLAKEPEESDVIHDFLAYLAEKMIEYNTTNEEEMKSFMKWFEREIGTEVDKLTNKTLIKNYHENTLNKFLGILKKNKKSLKIDPTRRDFQDKVSREFKKSIAKLTLPKQNIEATDSLIDRVIYKLYDLTEEEIKIVENSLKSE